MLPVFRQMIVKFAHDPCVTEHHHPLIHVYPFFSARMADVNCSQCSPVVVQPVDFEMHHFPGDQLDETIFGGIAPMLPVLWAIDGIQPDCDFASAHIHDYSIAVDNPHDLGSRESNYKLFYRGFAERLLFIRVYAAGRNGIKPNGPMTTGRRPCQDSE